VSVKLLIRAAALETPPDKRWGAPSLLAGLLQPGCGDLSGEGPADLVKVWAIELPARRGRRPAASASSAPSADSPALLALLLSDDGLRKPLGLGQRPDHAWSGQAQNLQALQIAR